MRQVLACMALAWAACGGQSETASPRRDAGVTPAPDAAITTVAARPLGQPDLAAFQWRRRAAHAAYRDARTGEATGDWERVVAGCRAVLAADAQHLEAAWLLAIGLGKLGRVDEIVAPLYTAVAGDFAKWAQASLEHPALAAFLAAPIGRAWRERVEQDRAAFTAALARALYVTAAGDLFAYDADARRWYRLTHTHGAVLGGLAVPAADRIVYVARQRAKRAPHATTLAAGQIDLSRGRTLAPIELGTRGPIAVAYATSGKPGPWIRRPAGAGAKWQLLEYGGKLTSLPATAVRPPGAWLEVTGKRVRPRAIPIYDVTADFDDKGLASAIRVGRSNRILSIPSPGLIDGNSVRWSPDRTRLVFVAQLDDECTAAANAAAFVADTTTGALRELERAAGGLTVGWLSDRKPVVAGDRGVSILDLDGAAAIPLAGADALLTPRARPKCTPPDTDTDEAPLPADDSDLPETNQN